MAITVQEIYSRVINDTQRQVELNDILPIINRCYEEIAIFSKGLVYNYTTTVFANQETTIYLTGDLADLSIVEPQFATATNESDNTVYPLVYFKDYSIFKLIRPSYPSFSVLYSVANPIFMISGVPGSDPYKVSISFVFKPKANSLQTMTSATKFNEHLNAVYYHYTLVNVIDLLMAKEKDSQQIEILRAIQNSHLLYLLDVEYLKPFISLRLGGTRER